MDTFDVSDRSSWYFGSMSRQEATEVLMNERERGVFLVRDSNSIEGDYVLCVREDTKVSNYIINKVQQQDQIVFRIGDQSFENLPKLLTFYTLHYLDTTPLRRPALKKIEKDQDDLPFQRGEVLTIIRKDEDQWWTARSSTGQIGQIPVPYVQKFYDDSIGEDNVDQPTTLNISSCLARTNISYSANCDPPTVSTGQFSTLKRTDLNRKLPARARVKQSRVPNAYDKTALKLEIGDIIKVTKTNINGQWEGELNGRKGHFPFTHVEFVEDCDLSSNCTNIRFNSANDWVEQH
ncbi:adapter molecule Crk isoform X2 [Drosophila albomicans]|uniref:Adapter molecule Crk isoform X2 n=1 Tax=Drosophila albomicans TaxID=7291 RepID=A0A6P8XL03_DROAB|nr:adapter molecule Crk isoform X2 [Drosophila albomicans]